MGGDWRVVFVIAKEKQLADELIERLVSEGFSRDEALCLVRFPHDI